MFDEITIVGSRITTIFNFGYVSLNILHLRAEDAGSYTVRAVNRLGEAVSSASLRVFGEYLRKIIHIYFQTYCYFILLFFSLICNNSFSHFLIL